MAIEPVQNFFMLVLMEKSPWQKSSCQKQQDIQHQLFKFTMDKIISNTVQSKITSFIKFIEEEQHQLDFVATIV